MSQNTESVEAASLKKRYADSYIVARATVGVGKLFKGFGILIASFVIIAAAIAGAKLGYDASNAPYPLRSDPGTAALLGVACLVGGIVVAALTGGVLYLLGILIGAQGQILKASLDEAVNTSPFLTNEYRALIMSLR
jgi:hypothetical protein